MEIRSRLLFIILAAGSIVFLGLSYLNPDNPFVFGAKFIALNCTSISSILSSRNPSGAQIPSTNCGYLIRRSWAGRLGNLMFQYASFYGISKAHIRKYAFASNMPQIFADSFTNLSLFLRFTDEQTEIFLANSTIKNLNEHECCRFEPIDRSKLKCDNNNNDSFEIHGYRQSYKYFDHAREEIRREFSNFDVNIRDECDRRFENISIDHPNCSIVGVHLRRGDFTLTGKIQYGHAPATDRYFQRAIRFFEETYFSNLLRVDPKFKCLVFLIFGDDYQWNLRASENITFASPNSTRLEVIDSSQSSAAVDLCLLTKCDHVAMSTGTFGWWAGYLGRGIVTYQREFAQNYLRTEYVPSDFFLSDWIPL